MSGPNIRAILDRPRQVPIAASAAAPMAEPEIETADTYQPFARGLIGNRAQLVLRFRKANGHVRGISYSYFYAIGSDDPSGGFVIDFSHAKVEVTGKNLEHLFRLVCEHRVLEIVESARHQSLARPSDEPIVERIEFK